MQYLLIVLSILIILIGLIGAVFPMIPGIPLMLIGTIIIALWVEGGSIPMGHLYIYASITLISILIDYAGGIIGAKVGRATKMGIWGAILGAFLGTIILGPIGIIIGPALGVFIIEMLYRRNFTKSLRASGTTFLSSIAGIAVNFLLALSFLVILVLDVINII